MIYPDIDERNALIVEAYKLGATRNQIAEMASLTPHYVNQLLKKLVPGYSFKRVYKTSEDKRKKALANHYRKKPERIDFRTTKNPEKAWEAALGQGAFN